MSTTLPAVVLLCDEPPVPSKEGVGRVDGAEPTKHSPKNTLCGAGKRATRLGVSALIEQADVEELPYPDHGFDTVTATSVFCSVADPVRGLQELRRVVRTDGQVLLLEHVRPRVRGLGWLFDLLPPITRRLFGPEINRRTEENVARAGLEILELRKNGIWREIVARPGRTD